MRKNPSLGWGLVPSANLGNTNKEMRAFEAEVILCIRRVYGSSSSNKHIQIEDDIVEDN